jgi:CspA family cold shock protein
MDGTIKTLLNAKGCGFIKGDNNKDYFFHRSALKAGARFEDLREGQPVTFEDSEGAKGLRAEDVFLA